MARPTKQKQGERAKIEDVLKRDMGYYLNLEERCKSEAVTWGEDCFMPYALSDDVYFRNSNDKFNLISEITKEAESTEIKSEQLFFTRYFSLDDDVYLIDDEGSYIHESKNYGGMVIDKEKALSRLNPKRVGLENMPIILQNYRAVAYHKRALIEIDFTKPKDEILAIITRIKDDFDNDHTIIQGLDEYVGLVSPREPYMCNIKECDIYKHKNPKPLQGRLADTFFIYDCNKMELTKDYAMGELNRYWNDVKKIHTEKIHDKTYFEYLNFAKKLIDDMEYADFQKGIKNSLTK